MAALLRAPWARGAWRPRLALLATKGASFGTGPTKPSFLDDIEELNAEVAGLLGDEDDADAFARALRRADPPRVGPSERGPAGRPPLPSSSLPNALSSATVGRRPMETRSGHGLEDEDEDAWAVEAPRQAPPPGGGARSSGTPTFSPFDGPLETPRTPPPERGTPSSPGSPPDGAHNPALAPPPAALPSAALAQSLTHVDSRGEARMVDVGGKPWTRREATAEARVRLGPESFSLVERAELRKGDVLAVARLAGIQGAKAASSLVPLCHPIFLSEVAIEASLEGRREPQGAGGGGGDIVLRARAATVGPTGVEIEAMAGAMAAALAAYDMVKGVERGAEVVGVRLLEKKGGKSGHWTRRP